MNTAHPPKVSTRRVIWTCKCGTKAYDYTATRLYHHTDRLFGQVKYGEARLTREVNGEARDISHDAACPVCKRHRKSAHVVGTVTEHKCGAKCRSSKGPVCECSCGGAHHGGGFL
jgi:hypothetical protein